MKQLLPYVFISILFGGYIWYNESSKKSVSDLINQLNQKDSIFFSKINSSGQREVDAEVREYQPIIIRESNQAEFVRLRETLKELNISINQLKSKKTITSTSSGADSTIVYVKDTLNQTYEFSDSTEFLTLKGEFSLRTRKLDYNYKYKNKISLYSYDYTANNFFKKPDLRVRVTSDDPSAQMDIQTFSVNPPKELISVGAGLGVGALYDNNTLKIRPVITIGVYKPLYTIYK